MCLSILNPSDTNKNNKHKTNSDFRLVFENWRALRLVSSLHDVVDFVSRVNPRRERKLRFYFLDPGAFLKTGGRSVLFFITFEADFV